jgi:methylated-DNA-protein-cysteine methyltransferase-like protein
LAGSIAFARMRAALLEQVRSIPAGQAVALPDLAASLNIPSRHAAYMLSQLSEDERAMVPRHRVAPKGMHFGRKRTPAQEEQIALLGREGLHLAPDGALVAPPEGWMALSREHADRFWADDA